MGTDLAIGDANDAALGLYSSDQSNAVGDWNYWDGYRPYPWYPTPVYPVYPLTIHMVTINTNTKQHRHCTCPKCDGGCCDCADCEVARLKTRVAELERAKDG